MSHISRSNRQFEFFLFGGIPENPQSIYEPAPNSHAEPRPTRQPGGSPTLDEHEEPGGADRLVGRVQYNRKTGEAIVKFEGMALKR